VYVLCGFKLLVHAQADECARLYAALLMSTPSSSSALSALQEARQIQGPLKSGEARMVG
jgi:hypothetical protein